MKRIISAATMCLLLGLLLANCTLPRPAPAEISPADAVNTSAAATVVSLSTELATKKVPSIKSSPSSLTTTPPAPGDPTTPQTASDTPAPLAQATAEPTITIDPDAPCNRAGFVRDVTIPDNSTLPPDSPFTKVWEIQNTGSCTWTPEYSVVFTGIGDRMSGQDPTPLITSGEVKPGQTTMVAVAMKAPGEAGEYKGNWWLSDPEGTDFGLGTQAQSTIYVQIKVGAFYSFAEHMCSAKWSNGTQNLPCPSEIESSQGSVTLVSDPMMENGVNAAGLGLKLIPQQITGGYIVGHYPAIVVPAEADFRAIVGCDPQAQGCYASFVLTYQVDNGPEQTLAEWNEGYDQNVNEIAADLNALSGMLASFNLYVYVSGEPSQSKAIWVDPRITP